MTFCSQLEKKSKGNTISSVHCQKCQKYHNISVIIKNVKYHITAALKHSYNTESKSYQSKSYQLLVANSATLQDNLSTRN